MAAQAAIALQHRTPIANGGSLIGSLAAARTRAGQHGAADGAEGPGEHAARSHHALIIARTTMRRVEACHEPIADVDNHEPVDA